MATTLDHERQIRVHKRAVAPLVVVVALALATLGAGPAAALTDPDGHVTTPAANGATFPTAPIGLAGNAVDDVGVTSMALVIRKPATSEFWNGTTWTSTNASVPAVLSAPGATSTGWTYAFNPPAPGSFSVVATALDVEGHVDATPPFRTFSLVPPNNPAPFVSNRTPRSGATNVQPSSTVSVTFSEPVVGVGSSTFTLAPAAGGAALLASITQVGTTNQYVLDPSTNLQPGTSYRASLTGGTSAIRDVSGVPLVSASWMFTTVAGQDPAPFVSARSPLADETGVPLTADVSVTFSEAVQGVSGTTFQLRPAAGGQAVAASVAQVGTTNEYVLDPTANLSALTQYTVTLTGGATAIRDTTGQALPATSWTFTTVSAQNPAPFISSRSPLAGATGVSVTGNVTVTFSEPVVGVSTTTFTLAPTGGPVVAATVTQGTGNQFVLDPSASLAAGTSYTVTVTGGPTAIRDTSGAAFSTVSWSFTTAAATNPAPFITARSPLAGATGVGAASNITVTFSEAVLGVSGTTLTVAPASGGAAVAAAVTEGSGNQWVLNPNVNLASATQYRVTVTGGPAAVRDTTGVPFVTTTWTFTTASAPNPAPFITARTPGTNASGVAIGANVTATFSEEVQGVSTTTFQLRGPGGQLVAATVGRNGTTNQWVLNPNASLAAATTYSVTLTGGASGIRDLTGLALATATWSFSTA